MDGILESVEAIAALDGGGVEGEEATRDCTELLVGLKSHIDSAYKRPEGVYSRARKMIKEKIGRPAIDKAARAIIRQSKAEFDCAQAASAKVLEIKNKNQTVLALACIERVVERLRGGSTFEDHALLLMLCCGARKGEILNPAVSKFEYVVGEDGKVDDRKILQDGVSKKRTEGEFKIVKPLLWIKAGEFLDTLEIVRNEMFKCLAEKADTDATMTVIAKSCSSKLERYCGHLWPQHVYNGYRTGTHINRAIYANVAHALHGGPRSSLTSFVKEVLGHEAMGTAANYMNVAVAMPGDRARMEEAKRQSEQAFEGKLVEAMDRDGVPHLVEKIPIRQMSKPDRTNLLFATIRSLESENIEPEKKLLKALGFDGKFLAVCL